MAWKGTHSLLQAILLPLDSLEIGPLYNRYHAVVDFVLYSILLVVICRAGLCRTMPGTHGRKIGTALGLVLAASLSAVAGSLGITIASFGLVGAGILTGVAVLVVYKTMRCAGLSHVLSSATSLILLYLCLQAMTPDLFVLARDTAVYVHFVLLIALVLALFGFIHAIFFPSEVSRLALLRRQLSEAILGPKEGISQWTIAHREVVDLAMRGKRESKTVISLLRRIIDLIHNVTLGSTQAVCTVLRNVKEQEHVLESELTRIWKLDSLLLRFDLSQWHDLKSKYSQLTRDEKVECRKRFADERKSIRVDVTAAAKVPAIAGL